MRNNPSPRVRRVNRRIVLVNPRNGSVLLAQIAHIIIRRLAKSRPGVSCRVVDRSLETVQSIPIIKLISRLRSPVAVQILSPVNRGPKHIAELTPPMAKLHLIVSEVRPCVEEHGVLSPLADAHVPFPQVAMDDARLDGLTI